MTFEVFGPKPLSAPLLAERGGRPVLVSLEGARVRRRRTGGRAGRGEWEVVVEERAREVADVPDQHPPDRVQPRQVAVLPQRVGVAGRDQPSVGPLLEPLLLAVGQERRRELRLRVRRAENEVVGVGRVPAAARAEWAPRGSAAAARAPGVRRRTRGPVAQRARRRQTLRQLPPPAPRVSPEVEPAPPQRAVRVREGRVEPVVSLGREGVLVEVVGAKPPGAGVAVPAGARSAASAASMGVRSVRRSREGRRAGLPARAGEGAC